MSAAGEAGRGEAGQAGQAGTRTGFQCPAGPFGEPFAAGASATRIAGLPPADAFNSDGNTRTNVEGPVWIGDKLYVSEFAFMPAPDARILALDPISGAVSVAVASAGSNGLAVEKSGALIATDHKQGAVVRMPFPLGTAEVITSMFEGKRFNSPNDLAIRSDGTLYFSDPDYQAPSTKPQPKTRVYLLAAGAQEPVVIDDARSQPNGVTLSADENTLYVAGADGVFSYPVMSDGSVMPGSGTRLNAFNGGADGMGMDCAGNLYITSAQRVVVLSKTGTEIGAIAVPGAESVTNVAFGGPEHKTLFITSMGSGEQRGVFRSELAVPGFPY
jgi:gluconolactonase